MITLPNVRFSTARIPTGSPNGLPVLYLYDQLGAIEQMHGNHQMVLPQAAVKCTYILSVEANCDIAVGDQVVSVTALDRVTPWPNDVTATTNAWWVRYLIVGSPSSLTYRYCYLDRVQTTGATHL